LEVCALQQFGVFAKQYVLRDGDIYISMFSMQFSLNIST